MFSGLGETSGSYFYTRGVLDAGLEVLLLPLRRRLVFRAHNQAANPQRMVYGIFPN